MLLAISLLVVAGCGQPGVTPMATAVSQEGTSVSQDDLQSWIRFRLTWGLRADVEWVVAVAGDPTATSDAFDVPLLSSEFQQVLDASSAADSLLPIARKHAQYSPEFAGAWIELPRVALAFTDHLPEHRAEVEALFGDRVVVHPARYTIRELNAHVAEVEADEEWFTTNGIGPVYPSLVQSLNEVRLRLPWPDPGTEARIRERFNDTGWMAFTYDGPPPWTGPLGDLEITIVDADGQPAAVYCLLVTSDPRVMSEEFSFVEDGRCFYEGLPAVRWTLRIDNEQRNERVDRDFLVPPGGVERATVVIGTGT